MIFNSFFLLNLALSCSAYTWTIQNTPRECSDLTIKVSGNDGKPPYRVLVVPNGPPPLSHREDVRSPFEVQFPGDSDEVTFKLNYPQGSKFTAVVSDASAFASGGTSAGTNVGSSDDSSCYSPTTSAVPDFYFSVNPENALTCSVVEIQWNYNGSDHQAHGTPYFRGVIPGGQSFEIPQGPITQFTTQLGRVATGFEWTVALRDQTSVYVVAGDDRGLGSGGWIQLYPTLGAAHNTACLNDAVPSSTPGTPVGAVETGAPTKASTSSSSPSPSDSSSISSSNAKPTSMGPIVGGVVGGLGFVIIAALFVWRRKRKQTRRRHELEAPRRAWIVKANEDAGHHGRTSKHHEANQLSPLPYSPDPTSAVESPTQWTSSSWNTSTPTSRQVGYGSELAPNQRLPISPHSSTSRTTVIRHEDAGAAPVEMEHEERIELPPAYATIRGTRTQAQAQPAPRGKTR